MYDGEFGSVFVARVNGPRLSGRVMLDDRGRLVPAADNEKPIDGERTDANEIYVERVRRARFPTTRPQVQPVRYTGNGSSFSVVPPSSGPTYVRFRSASWSPFRCPTYTRETETSPGRDGAPTISVENIRREKKTSINDAKR